MNVWYAVWRLATYKARLTIALEFFSEVNGYYLPLLLGLVTREFYNTLTGQGDLAWDVWAVVGLFMAVNVVMHLSQVAVRMAGSAIGWAYRMALLQRNLFKNIMDNPPLYSGPSTGDSINRFRDDGEAVGLHVPN